MFIDQKTQTQIHANLNESVSHGTLRSQNLLPAFLEVIKDTAEYCQLISCPAPGYPWPNSIFSCDAHEWWDSDEACEIGEEIHTILNDYAPEGFYFGTHPGDGSDFGYWENVEEE